jgi:hypothetical protein
VPPVPEEAADEPPLPVDIAGPSALFEVEQASNANIAPSMAWRCACALSMKGQCTSCDLVNTINSGAPTLLTAFAVGTVNAVSFGHPRVRNTGSEGQMRVCARQMQPALGRALGLRYTAWILGVADGAPFTKGDDGAHFEARSVGPVLNQRL